MERGGDTEDAEGRRDKCYVSGGVVSHAYQFRTAWREVDGCYAKRCTPVFVWCGGVCACLCVCTPLCVFVSLHVFMCISMQFATHSHVCFSFLTTGACCVWQRVLLSFCAKHDQ